MSDEKMVTEAEAVRRERQAVRRALYDQAGWSMQKADATATELYPAPMVTRPRVVTLNDTQWRVAQVGEGAAHRVEWNRGGAWEPWGNMFAGEAQRLMLADLLANPVEHVPADAGTAAGEGAR